MNYYGCIKTEGDKHWCPVNDGVVGVTNYKCSESCPTDNILATKKLSPKEIVAKLKKTSKVYSMIERDGDCEKVLGSYNVSQVRQKIEFFFEFTYFL